MNINDILDKMPSGMKGLRSEVFFTQSGSGERFSYIKTEDGDIESQKNIRHHPEEVGEKSSQESSFSFSLIRAVQEMGISQSLSLIKPSASTFIMFILVMVSFSFLPQGDWSLIPDKKSNDRQVVQSKDPSVAEKNSRDTNTQSNTVTTPQSTIPETSSSPETGSSAITTPTSEVPSPSSMNPENQSRNDNSQMYDPQVYPTPQQNYNPAPQGNYRPQNPQNSIPQRNTNHDNNYPNGDVPNSQFKPTNNSTGPNNTPEEGNNMKNNNQ